MNDNAKTWLWVAVVVGLVMMRGGGCTGIGGDQSPIPDAGLRVLIVFPEGTRDQLPAGQKSLLTSTKLRTWLDAHCAKNDLGDAEWRIEPDTNKFADTEPIWQKLMALPRQQSPWLVIADGSRGFTGPLPADEAALLAILTPFGGGK